MRCKTTNFNSQCLMFGDTRNSKQNNRAMKFCQN
jgi:hypothetical protein